MLAAAPHVCIFDRSVLHPPSFLPSLLRCSESLPSTPLPSFLHCSAAPLLRKPATVKKLVPVTSLTLRSTGQLTGYIHAADPALHKVSARLLPGRNGQWQPAGLSRAAGRRMACEETFSFRIRELAPGALRVLDMQDMEALRRGAQPYTSNLASAIIRGAARGGHAGHVCAPARCQASTCQALPTPRPSFQRNESPSAPWYTPASRMLLALTYCNAQGGRQWWRRAAAWQTHWRICPPRSMRPCSASWQPSTGVS